MSEKFPRELWDSPEFHKGREWGRMEERERIIALLEHEQSVMKNAGGATFGKWKNYDEGYNMALGDFKILIKGEEQ